MRSEPAKAQAQASGAPYMVLGACTILSEGKAADWMMGVG